MALGLGEPMRDTRRYFAPQDQESVLHATAAQLLAEEGQSVPGWEIVGPEIGAEIVRQSSQLLAEAGTDYDAFDRVRVRAAYAYGRVDSVVCGLAGATAGYLFLIIAGREFLQLAAANPGLGLTPLILGVLAVALAIRCALW